MLMDSLRPRPAEKSRSGVVKPSSGPMEPAYDSLFSNPPLDHGIAGAKANPRLNSTKTPCGVWVTRSGKPSPLTSTSVCSKGAVGSGGPRGVLETFGSGAPGLVKVALMPIWPPTLNPYWDSAADPPVCADELLVRAAPLL